MGDVLAGLGAVVAAADSCALRDPVAALTGRLRHRPGPRLLFAGHEAPRQGPAFVRAPPDAAMNTMTEHSVSSSTWTVLGLVALDQAR